MTNKGYHIHFHSIGNHSCPPHPHPHQPSDGLFICRSLNTHYVLKGIKYLLGGSLFFPRLFPKNRLANSDYNKDSHLAKAYWEPRKFKAVTRVLWVSWSGRCSTSPGHWYMILTKTDSMSTSSLSSWSLESGEQDTNVTEVKNN